MTEDWVRDSDIFWCRYKIEERGGWERVDKVEGDEYDMKIKKNGSINLRYLFIYKNRKYFI